MNTFFEDESGFTVVELIISTAMLSVILTYISYVLLFSININSNLQRNSILIEESTIALNFVQIQLENAIGYKIDSTKTLLTVDNGSLISTIRFNSMKNCITYGNNIIANNVEKAYFEISDKNNIDFYIKMNDGNSQFEIFKKIDVKYKQKLK